MSEKPENTEPRVNFLEQAIAIPSFSGELFLFGNFGNQASALSDSLLRSIQGD